MSSSTAKRGRGADVVTPAPKVCFLSSFLNCCLIFSLSSRPFLASLPTFSPPPPPLVHAYHHTECQEDQGFDLQEIRRQTFCRCDWFACRVAHAHQEIEKRNHRQDAPQANCRRFPCAHGRRHSGTYYLTFPSSFLLYCCCSFALLCSGHIH